MKKFTSVEEVLAALRKEGRVEVEDDIFLLTKEEVEKDLMVFDTKEFKSLIEKGSISLLEYAAIHKDMSLVKNAKKEDIFIKDGENFLETITAEDIAELL